MFDNDDIYIIAEIGVNHECSINLAKKMIKQAKNSGANAVKFQSYKADKIASKNSPLSLIPSANSPLVIAVAQNMTSPFIISLILYFFCKSLNDFLWGLISGQDLQIMNHGSNTFKLCWILHFVKLLVWTN